MLTKILRYYHTLKFLKPVQLYHQVLYRLVKSNKVPDLAHVPTPFPFQLYLYIQAKVEFIDTNIRFDFINKQKEFPESGINWNEDSFGKLWTYNLNYFEFLHSPNLSADQGFFLINDFIQKMPVIKDGLEPYPTSLRIMNWIKFLIRVDEFPPDITDSLYQQSYHLKSRLEYHLLGNHLLENAFALFFAGHFYQDTRLYNCAVSILKKQLGEQILKDGGHFELSPMYHQIMLYRVLDCSQIAKTSNWNPSRQIDLDSYASRMLGWLDQVSFSNTIPLLNDSARGICGTNKILDKYASDLSIKKKLIPLNESGYRKLRARGLEMIIDVGHVGPSYQPGHAHADTFSFELWFDGNPVIVDPGISTYEKNKTRDLERSTIFHNTLSINGENSSDTWGGFRVGQRAKVKVLHDEPNHVAASHNGYRKYGLTLSRSVHVGDNIIFQDEVTGDLKNIEIHSNLHFHPDCTVSHEGKNLRVGDLILKFEGYISMELKSYNFAAGFNKTIPSTKLVAFLKPISKIIIENAS